MALHPRRAALVVATLIAAALTAACGRPVRPSAVRVHLDPAAMSQEARRAPRQRAVASSRVVQPQSAPARAVASSPRAVGGPTRKTHTATVVQPVERSARITGEGLISMRD
jgi:hypothetical protein